MVKCLINNVPMMAVSTCWGRLEAMEGSTAQVMPLKERGGLLMICKVVDEMESVLPDLGASEGCEVWSEWGQTGS